MTRWRRRREEAGFTLVELSVSMALVAILLGTVLIVMNTFAKVETDTGSTYSELNQLVPVGTSFQRLLRTAVEPATGGTGKPPVPPFGVYKSTDKLTSATPISATELTFFSNTGTTTGPVKVTAKLTGSIFTVTTTSPQPTTCPSLGTPPRPYTDRCHWTAAPKTLFTVSHVCNLTTVCKFTTGGELVLKPVFMYYLVSPLNGTGTGEYGTPATLGKKPFATCTAPIQETTPTTHNRVVTVTRCPANKIESIKVDLEVKVGGGTSKVESQTVTYQLSTVSQTYSPAVG